MVHPPPTPEERRDRLVFYPVAVVGGLFSVTVLMTIAAAFGDPQAPVSKWLNRNATPLLLWETALLVGVSLLAMTLDRIRTLKKSNSLPTEPDASNPAPQPTHPLQSD